MRYVSGRVSHPKGYIMYDYDIVELADYNFNHMVHHYDDDVRELIEYAQENGSLSVHAEYDGYIYWDEHC